MRIYWYFIIFYCIKKVKTIYKLTMYLLTTQQIKNRKLLTFVIAKKFKNSWEKFIFIFWCIKDAFISRRKLGSYVEMKQNYQLDERNCHGQGRWDLITRNMMEPPYLSIEWIINYGRNITSRQAERSSQILTSAFATAFMQDGSLRL